MLFDPVYTFLSNLRTLGFDKAVHCKGIYSTISFQPTFTFNMRTFEVTSHFLFRALDKAKTKHNFRSCWPPNSSQKSREYNQIAFRWLQELKSTHKDSPLAYIALRKSYFEDYHHPTMNHVMMAFSALVLEDVLSRTMAVKSDCLDKEALEEKIQSLADQVSKKMDQVKNTRARWKREGEQILENLRDMIPKPKPILERVCFMEVKLELDKTLHQVKKRKLLKAKKSNGLRRQLADLLKRELDENKLYSLPCLPEAEPKPLSRTFSYTSPEREDPPFLNEIKQIYADIDHGEQNNSTEKEERLQESCSAQHNNYLAQQNSYLAQQRSSFVYMDSISLLCNEDPPSALMYDFTSPATALTHPDSDPGFDLAILTPYRS
ncbi:HAUS augmin-like complex subunit 6 N-terminus-domain-containing protein [Sporodiniella umbellata]|nr:HAUS augmin-like complex subunit 6 N-terminus-domain-containing protein [Sporodiniella umbellata]